MPLSKIFYDLSVSRNLLLKSEMRQFGASGNQLIWRCREPMDKMGTLSKEVGFWATERRVSVTISSISVSVMNCVSAAAPEAREEFPFT